MEGESLLTVTAEIGIAIAGFSGIAVALRGREGPWSDADRVRFQMLLRTSLNAVFFSLVPLVLDVAGLGGSPLWRVASALWLAYIAISLATIVPVMLRSGRTDPAPPSRITLAIMVGFLGTQVALQGINTIWLASAWPFVITVVLSLLLATTFFIRLLRGFVS